MGAVEMEMETEAGGAAAAAAGGRRQRTRLLLDERHPLGACLLSRCSESPDLGDAP